MYMQKPQLIQFLSEMGFSDRLIAQCDPLMRPAIRLTTRRLEGDCLDVGSSKLGGLPDLPSGVEWPHSVGLPAQEEAYWMAHQWLPGPLWFQAQIRLGDLATCDEDRVLPGTGILYFFAAMQKDGFPLDGIRFTDWKVFYYNDDPTRLSRARLPATAEAFQHALRTTVSHGIPPDIQLPETHQFPPCALGFSLFAHLPDGLLRQMADRMGEAACYEKNSKTLYDALTVAKEHVPCHHFLGYADILQGTHEWDFPATTKQEDSAEALRRFRRIESEPSEWRMLLQLDSDPELGFHWEGGWGRGYYYIRESDLVARRFDAVCLVNDHIF